jgi:hypothetical protein
MQNRENQLLLNKNILITDHEISLNYGFCGRIINLNSTDYREIIIEYLNNSVGNGTNNILLYLSGNIENILNHINEMNLFGQLQINQIFVISNFSSNYTDAITGLNNIKLINLGQVPLNINNVGIYFQQFFTPDKNYFSNIIGEHTFQTLTESNKPTNAFRNGIYLTPVVKEIDLSDDADSLGIEKIHFRLLRCSSNLSGPTDNFRLTDDEIVGSLNEISKYFFDKPFNLNHVLAQVYNNFHSDEGKDCKAKIKAHSDKTKDMQTNGIMAFCTFYNMQQLKLLLESNIDIKTFGYDYCYKSLSNSLLTKLRFRLKDCVSADIIIEKNLERKFDIILYPNSVFVMSLETNRLYTHEIVPSSLPIELLPTRMGYVVRCSSTEAVYDIKTGNTYIRYEDEDKETYHQLHKMNPEEMNYIKEVYYKENMTSEKIVYDKVYSSMNEGDYMEPIV